MRSNHVTPVTIFLDILLVSCLAFIGRASTECNSGTQDAPERTGELAKNPRLSTPEECARTCYEGEPPKTCYYHFTLEYYNVLGEACDICTPNNTTARREDCQCVLADGVERTFLAVNRMLPGPKIEVCKGDQVVVDVRNSMAGLEVTIHWHGILQNGYQYYDGVQFVTQCPILAFNTFRYQWVANNAGTHFWHSHDALHRTEGIYGILVVREPLSYDPNKHLYDEDLSSNWMIISDWFHELSYERVPGGRNRYRGQDPESILINGKGQYTNPTNGSTTNTPLEVFTIKPGRRYRFRMINTFSTTCSVQLIIQGHGLTLIATDGRPVQPVNIGSIISFSGERHDFVIDGNQPRGAYWIQLRGLGRCGINRVQQFAILRYEGGPDKPSSRPPTYDNCLSRGVVLNPLDAICDAPRKDAICISQLKHASPIDKGILEPHPDVKIYLGFNFLERTPEQNFAPNTYSPFLVTDSGLLVAAYINGFSFGFPSSPPLSQLKDISPETICNENKRPADCKSNCTCTHRVDIPLNSLVEVIFVDEGAVTNVSHPMHLHGYTFNVVGMGRSPDKNVTKITMKHVRDLDKKGLLGRNRDTVPYKDTIPVPNNGYAIFRFRANNPGEWLFHCHLQWHTAVGMQMIFHVGTTEDLPPVPKGFPTCANFEPPIPPIDVDDRSIYSKSHPMKFKSRDTY